MKNSRGKEENDVYLESIHEKEAIIKLIKKQKKEMELILNHLSDAVIKIDRKGNYTYLNRKAEENLSHAHKDFMYLNNKELYAMAKYHDINGKTLAFEETPVEKVRRGEEFTNEIIIIRGNKFVSYFECDGTPLYNKNGQLNGGILFYRDISDQFKIEEYRLLQENKEGLLLSYASLSYDDFKVKYINESGFNEIKKAKSYIQSVFEVIGEDFFSLYTGDEILIQTIKNAIKEKKPYNDKQKFIQEGKERYVKSMFQPILGENNKILKVLVIGIDITDEELAKQKMAYALKLQDEVLVNTSHELKTPLNIISSISQLVNLYLENDSLETVKDQLLKSNQIIRQNCYRLTKLINNILDSAKLESGSYKLNLSNHNIVTIIDDIVESVAAYTKATGHDIIFDTEAEEIFIALDVEKFERVLLNLISNAIKFSDKNQAILINLAVKNSAIEISVKDRGVGIDEEHIDSIFNKFVQVNTSLSRISEGTGIGLSLVQSITELHGGRVWVESSLGEGSTFTIKLPIRRVDALESKEDTYMEMDMIEKIKFELSDIYD